MSGHASESKPRRQFTEEFKREAVRLAQERGNVSAVARELGLVESCLNRWKRHLEVVEARGGKSSGGGGGKSSGGGGGGGGGGDNGSSPERAFPGNGRPRDEQVSRLERENARLREENEILKKAVGIFTNRPR